MTHPPQRRRRRRRANPISPWSAALLGALAAVAVMAILLLLPQTPAPQPAETSPTLPPSPYGPEDFVYDGGFLTCTAGRSRQGIDVSAHQGAVDWQQVRDAGIEFAMIRIGYRGYSQGGIHADEYAIANLEGARAAGLDVGVYFYSQATDIEEAAQEALYCIRFLEDYEIQMPVVFDWEYVSSDARTGNMDADTLTQCARVFCSTVEKSGYEAMVYFNPSIGQTLLDLVELREYPFWLAMYSDVMDYPHAVQMWQYTETGTVPGIQGNVDLNIQFLE